MYCQECGHHFRTIGAAEKAAFGANGCPKCGGSDIDEGKPTPPTEDQARDALDRRDEARISESIGRPFKF